MKRWISFWLALCIAISLLAVPAGAADAGLDHFIRSNPYSPGQYSDVPAGSSFSENIQAGYEFGIMQGYGSTFGVSNSITRLASIIIACRIHSIYHTGINEIESTYSGTTQEKYLQYAQENRLFCEFSDYSAPASRAEFAVILGSALPDAALSPINTVEAGAIPDVSASAAYSDAVYRLYRAGILNGSDAKGTFYPAASITRGAACAIATRMCSEALRKSVTLTKPAEILPIGDPSGNTSSDSRFVPSLAYGTEYVLNMNTMKFHYPYCSSVSTIRSYNRQDYIGTRADLIAIGYDPCGRCHP